MDRAKFLKLFGVAPLIAALRSVPKQPAPPLPLSPEPIARKQETEIHIYFTPGSLNVLDPKVQRIVQGAAASRLTPYP